MSKLFTEDHEWIEVNGDIATIGITDYAQEQLGDVVFVELPDNGKSLTKGDDAAVIESVKAASEIKTPLSGEVSEANGDIVDDPAKVNSDAEGDAWFLRIKISDKSELDGLMDEAAYKASIA